MEKKLLIKVVAVGAVLLTFFALATSASACIWGVYQPEEPEVLR